MQDKIKRVIEGERKMNKRQFYWALQSLCGLSGIILIWINNLNIGFAVIYMLQLFFGLQTMKAMKEKD